MIPISRSPISLIASTVPVRRFRSIKGRRAWHKPEWVELVSRDYVRCKDNNQSPSRGKQHGADLEAKIGKRKYGGKIAETKNGSKRPEQVSRRPHVSQIVQNNEFWQSQQHAKVRQKVELGPACTPKLLAFGGQDGAERKWGRIKSGKTCAHKTNLEPTILLPRLENSHCTFLDRFFENNKQEVDKDRRIQC